MPFQHLLNLSVIATDAHKAVILQAVCELPETTAAPQYLQSLFW